MPGYVHRVLVTRFQDSPSVHVAASSSEGSGPSDVRSVSEPVCFTCGMQLGEPMRLNRLDNGQICPACRERVLSSLPPVLPSRPPERLETPELPFDSYDVYEEPGSPPAAS
jgi:DNA-directed RNA polymerase subunit RPC12/RpoP